MELTKLRELADSLTLTEKIGQLVQLSGSFFSSDPEISTGPATEMGITRDIIENAGSTLNVMGADKVRQMQEEHLKKSRIPMLFMGDIIYGYKTVYPVPLALGASFNPDLIRQDYANIAEECSAGGIQLSFSPMVDVARDARWGRCVESPGEDPYLNSVMGAAMVQGFQGESLEDKTKVASCVKHFAAYGAVESGRDYNTVDMSRWRFLQDYADPYKAAVDAGCEMVMTSFNTIEGVPSTANTWLLSELLRKEWGFEGVIITDYSTIQELVAHGVAEDLDEATCKAINNTVDIDMMTAGYANHLAPLLEKGKVSMEKLDEAVWRILLLKNKLGLFEDPFRGADAAREAEVNGCDRFLQASRKTAEECMVLLQNKNEALPIAKDAKIAILGPYQDSKSVFGMWALTADRSLAVSLKEAFEAKAGSELVCTATGCEILDDFSVATDMGMPEFMAHVLPADADPQAELEKAIALAEWADLTIFAVGEFMLQSGEAASRTDITLPKPQRDFIAQVAPHAAKSAALLFNGRPLAIEELTHQVDAILECFFPGTRGCEAICDIVYGDVNPSGRLTMSFPYNVGQEPLYYAHMNTGRPYHGQKMRFVSKYLDAPNTPLFPFGYGLSYHSSELTNGRLEGRRVSLDVTNTGKVDGKEVVQLYIHDVAASVVRPVKELKAFRKVELAAGETKTLSFEITDEMLSFVNAAGQRVLEPGRFEILIGKNAEDTPIQLELLVD